MFVYISERPTKTKDLDTKGEEAKLNFVQRSIPDYDPKHFDFDQFVIDAWIASFITFTPNQNKTDSKCYDFI